PLTHHPPSSTLFPYTTLFRSRSEPFCLWRRRRHRRRRAAPGQGRSGCDASRIRSESFQGKSEAPSTARVTVLGWLDIRSLEGPEDRKSTRLNSSHVSISYAVF